MNPRALRVLRRLIPLACAASATAQSPTGSRATGMPVLLIVHGRDTQTDDVGALKREWSDALNVGLIQGNVDPTLIPDSARRFVYYGDVFAKGAVHEKCRDVTLVANVLEPVVEPTSEPANSGNGILRLAKSFTTFLPGDLTYRIIMTQTRDTEEYITRGSPSCSVRNIFLDSFRDARASGRPIVVVAHSQGALLTYEYEGSTEGWGHELGAFVSIGSQFGFDALMTHFGAKAQKDGAGISTPPGVGAVWYNFFDDQDAVAFAMDGRYASTLHSEVREYRAQNSLPFRHTATGYLSNGMVALGTASAWCAAYGAPKPDACADVRARVEHGELHDEPSRRADKWAIIGAPLRLVPLAIYAFLAYRIVR